MEFHIVKRLGQRLLADPALQHFYAVLIAHDVRFLGAGAQSIDQLGGPPMGMHVDHGYLLCLSSNGLTPKVQVSGTSACQLWRNLSQPSQRSKRFHRSEEHTSELQ